MLAQSPGITGSTGWAQPCLSKLGSPEQLPLGWGEGQAWGLTAWPGMDQGPPGAKGIRAGSLEMLLPAKATKTPSSTRV